MTIETQPQAAEAAEKQPESALQKAINALTSLPLFKAKKPDEADKIAGEVASEGAAAAPPGAPAAPSKAAGKEAPAGPGQGPLDRGDYDDEGESDEDEDEGEEEGGEPEGEGEEEDEDEEETPARKSYGAYAEEGEMGLTGMDEDVQVLDATEMLKSQELIAEGMTAVLERLDKIDARQAAAEQTDGALAKAMVEVAKAIGAQGDLLKSVQADQDALGRLPRRNVDPRAANGGDPAGNGLWKSADGEEMDENAVQSILLKGAVAGIIDPIVSAEFAVNKSVDNNLLAQVQKALNGRPVGG